MTTKKKIIIIVSAVVGALLLIYLGFSLFFMSHFFFGTTMGEVSISGSSVEQVKSRIEEGVKAYHLVIKESDDSEEIITASDINLQTDWDDSIETALNKQQAFLWPSGLWNKVHLDGNTSVIYDEEALKTVIDALACMQEDRQVPAEDAYLVYDESKGFYIEDEVLGTVIKKDVLEQKIAEAVRDLNPLIVLREEACYVDPLMKDDKDLVAAFDKAKTYAKSEITYTIGETSQVVDVKTFGPWLSREGSNILMDDEQLDAFVDSLCKSYNTCYDYKTLHTSYGTDITVTNVRYGWKVDFDKEKEQLAKEIASGEAISRDLNYAWTAASHEGNDYGNSYVEINLTAQHLFLIENGTCVFDTDFVSGNVDGEHDTPPGIFGITYCQRNAILRGPGYATPVSYWMPFNGDIGMHDAGWRDGFGGLIYQGNGSHGCVNLPVSAAATIFDKVEKGFPVICYFLPGTEPQVDNTSTPMEEPNIDEMPAGEVTPPVEEAASI